jgi:hypothetical protein
MLMLSGSGAGGGCNNILADDVPDVHTSPIYVEKSAGYKTVSTALAKKLRIGNMAETSLVKLPAPRPNPENAGKNPVTSGNSPGDNNQVI